MGFLNDLLSDNTVRKVEQFTKPGTANVSPRDLEKLRPLIEHYRKSPHPFTACYRDQIKHGLSPNHAARRCAVLKDLMMGTTSWRKGGQVAKEANLDGFEQLEAEEEIRKHLDEVPTEEQYLGEILGLIRHAPLIEIRERFAKVRGDNPRWPKGTPGIGGQWRPDGMPDSSVAIATSALGGLGGDARHKQLAKNFNVKAKDVDWKNESNPDEKTRQLLRETVVAPLRGMSGGAAAPTADIVDRRTNSRNPGTPPTKAQAIRERKAKIRELNSHVPAFRSESDRIERDVAQLRDEIRDIESGRRDTNGQLVGSGGDSGGGSGSISQIARMRAGEEITLPNGTRVRRLTGAPVEYSLTPKGSNTSHSVRPRAGENNVEDRARQMEADAGGGSSRDSLSIAAERSRNVQSIIDGFQGSLQDKNKLYRAYREWTRTGDDRKLKTQLKRHGYNPDGTPRGDAPSSGGRQRSAPTGDTGNLPSAGETKHFPGDGGTYKVEAKADGGYAITRPSGTTRNFKKPAGAKRFMRAHNVGGTSSRNAEAPRPPQPRGGRAARNAARRADREGTPGGPRSGRAARNADRQARNSENTVANHTFQNPENATLARNLMQIAESRRSESGTMAETLRIFNSIKAADERGEVYNARLGAKINDTERSIGDISGRQKSYRQKSQADGFAADLSPEELDQVIAHYEANPPRKAPGKKIQAAAKSLKARREQRDADLAARRPISGLSDGVKARIGPGEGRSDGMIDGEVDGTKLRGYKTSHGGYIAYYDGEQGWTEEPTSRTAKEAVEAAAKRFRDQHATSDNERMSIAQLDDLSDSRLRQLVATGGVNARQAEALLRARHRRGGTSRSTS